MKWITRQNVHVDRTASAWLIRNRIDPQAEFAFVEADTDPRRLDGHTFDMRGAEFGHVGTKCTFETLVERHDLTADAALVEMGRIVRDADVPPSRSRRTEAGGVLAILSGFRLTAASDEDRLRCTAAVWDALYAYCQAKVADMAAHPRSRRTPRPQLRYSKRVADHLREDV